jgi:hypothetical protein
VGVPKLNSGRPGVNLTARIVFSTPARIATGRFAVIARGRVIPEEKTSFSEGLGATIAVG